METANGNGRVISLREQLASRDDLRQKTIRIGGDLNFDVTIRRATVGERKEIMSQFKTGEEATDQDKMNLGIEMVKRLVMPPLSDDDFNQLPSIVADAITTEIIKFNGWGKQGAAELVDQFPVKQ